MATSPPHSMLSSLANTLRQTAVANPSLANVQACAQAGVGLDLVEHLAERWTARALNQCPAAQFGALFDVLRACGAPVMTLPLKQWVDLVHEQPDRWGHPQSVAVLEKVLPHHTERDSDVDPATLDAIDKAAVPTHTITAGLLKGLLWCTSVADQERIERLLRQWHQTPRGQADRNQAMALDQGASLLVTDWVRDYDAAFARPGFAPLPGTLTRQLQFVVSLGMSMAPKTPLAWEKLLDQRLNGRLFNSHIMAPLRFGKTHWAHTAVLDFVPFIAAKDPERALMRQVLRSKQPKASALEALVLAGVPFQPDDLDLIPDADAEDLGPATLAAMEATRMQATVPEVPAAVAAKGRPRL